MSRSSRPTPCRHLAVVVLVAAVSTTTGCGGSDEQPTTVSGPITVISSDGTQTRVVPTSTAPAVRTAATPAAQAQTPLHGVARLPIRADSDRADVRATERLIEALHDRGLGEQIGLSLLEVDATLITARTSRPRSAMAVCRAILKASKAIGLRSIRGISVGHQDPGDEDTALYIESVSKRCRRE